VRVITATNRDLETAVAEGQFREDLYFRLNVVTISLPPLRERREEIPFLTDHFLKKYSVQYNKPTASVSPDLARRFMEYDWPGNVRQLENMIKRMVVLGSEAAILHELQHPASPFAFRPHHPAPPLPRPIAGPLQPVPPPVASSSSHAFNTQANGDSWPTPAAPQAISAPVGFADAATAVAAVAGSAMAAAVPAGVPGAVSLKDIARTAAREAERELILRMLTRTRWNRKEAAEILGISYKALLYKIKENGLDKSA